VRRRFYPGDPEWDIDQASILDDSFISQLGRFDVVYSWGVLHHSGQMWKALENTASLVSAEGLLCLALYNDQGVMSSFWRWIKATYCRLPMGLKWLLVIPCFLRIWGPSIVRDFLRFRPFQSWREYSGNRGMSPWEDVVDWVGGFPFEVCKPEHVLQKCLPMGFQLIKLHTCLGSHGCNEFIFRKNA
jgi:hypothetical protein